MPIRLKDSEHFKWCETAGGLPLAEARSFGGVLYVMVCPLCGCFHEIKGIGQITPRCLLREYAHQQREHGQTSAWISLYNRWLKLYPLAAEHTVIFAATADMLAGLEGELLPERINADPVLP